MSGHSKWSTIKHKKAATDAKRGKLFTRVAKEITIAAREGGGDPAGNSRLRLAIDKAREANMPKENIDRAIKRGTGEGEGADYVELVYEGYAPHGIGVLIAVGTDNRNRTLADIRHTLNKYGGNMAEVGSVSWQFTRKGYLTIVGDVDQDDLFLVAADAGADDVQFGEDGAEVYTSLDAFQAVRETLEGSTYQIDEASLIYEPNAPIALEAGDTIQVLNLIEKLEELDDVEDVYSTLDVTDDIFAQMEAA